MDTPKPHDIKALSSLTRRLLVEAQVGTDVALPRAGTALENAHVYDAVARELVRESHSGRVHIIGQETGNGLIRSLVFRRLS
jgi:hypothetical protein